MNLSTILKALAGVAATALLGILLIVFGGIAAHAASQDVEDAPTRCVATVTIPSHLTLEDSAPVTITATMHLNATCKRTVSSLTYFVTDQNGLDIKTVQFSLKHLTATFKVAEPGEYNILSDYWNPMNNPDASFVVPQYNDSNTLHAKNKSVSNLTVHHNKSGSFTLKADAQHYDVNAGTYIPWRHDHVTFQTFGADGKWHTVAHRTLNDQGKAHVTIHPAHLTIVRALFESTIYTEGSVSTLR